MFACAILILSVACFVALAIHVRRRGGFLVALPALVWFALTAAFYGACIIDGLDNVLDVRLYNDLSNSLRLYSSFVFLMYAWLACE